MCVKCTFLAYAFCKRNLSVTVSYILAYEIKYLVLENTKYFYKCSPDNRRTSYEIVFDYALFSRDVLCR